MLEGSRETLERQRKGTKNLPNATRPNANNDENNYKTFIICYLKYIAL